MQSKKNLYIGALILVVIIGFTAYVMFIAGNKSEKNVVTDEVVNESEPIPTIDGAVKIDLTKDVSSKSVLLNIQNIPKGSELIEYELSYQAKEQGLQGVIGKIDLSDNKKDIFEKEITLGTCSSGKCVYHKVIGEIKLQLRFNGTYGERIFEKEYNLFP